jgi:ATP-dependent Lon protease
LNDDNPPKKSPFGLPSDPAFLKDFGQALTKELMEAPKLPARLFCMPIHSKMVFPGLMAPFYLSEPQHISRVNKVQGEHGIIGFVVPREESNSGDGRVFEADIFRHGVAVRILKKVNVPDAGSHVLVQGLKRFRIEKVLEEGRELFVSVQYLSDKVVQDAETEALVRALNQQVKELAYTQPMFSEEMRLAMANTPHPGDLSDLVAFTIAMSRAKVNRYIAITDVKKRLEFVLVQLKREYELMELQKKIQVEVNEKITKAQREFFLKEQLKQIQKELGIKGDEQSRLITRFRERLEELKLHKTVVKQLEEEIYKCEHASDMSPEYQVTRTYLEYILYLPWNETSKENNDLYKAKRFLDKNHFGLHKVKDRILEFLAVRQLNPNYAGSILCFVGPPGVGKTSLGESIAKSMGRKFFRFSLGGMRDEAEIKGHRRTYVGAMPGKIIQAIKRSGTSNPVILMDEIDKMGVSYQGDPASALLEVLDPEQNKNFLDHYIDVPFDLSKVLFILTANVMEEMPSPLLDRMELIELHGYNDTEKIRISKKYLIPKALEKHGLKRSQFRLPDTILQYMIDNYAREAGVRTLDQCIAKLMRKRAMQVVKKRSKNKLLWTQTHISKILGPSPFLERAPKSFKLPGLALGLAWTPIGGDILIIECLSLPTEAKKGDYKITGQVGDVMSESASIAYSYARKHARYFGAPKDFFEDTDIHIHIPAGAIPKDGPSAGIVLLTAMISLATKKILPSNLAMTGELSLAGNILPIGGVKEKLLAAKREGVKTVFLPRLNMQDVKQLESESKTGVKIKYFSNVKDILKIIFRK